MTAEERIRQLEAENAALREQLAAALEQLDQALGGSMSSKGNWRRIATRASSRRQVMAPDENGGASATKTRSRREGRKAHAGHSLMQVESPDEVVRHRLPVCEH